MDSDRHSQSMQRQLCYTSDISLRWLWDQKHSQSCIHLLAGHFPGLERLTIDSTTDFRDSSLLWHPSTFATLSAFPALHTLILERCSFPSFQAIRRMLSAVSRLSTLTLIRVKWPEPKRLPFPHGIGAAVPGHRPAISNLNISRLGSRQQAELLEWLCTTSTIRSIKHVHFSQYGEIECGERGKNRFLHMSASSIVELHCQAAGTYQTVVRRTVNGRIVGS